ncbi:MAG: prepilin-type N-terminal cleavage/methylation domain-containing protein [Candidatus Omnitrophica bacterium]|nr:prepilin-type N-terminal cleavage/methylation domain-containing protein [Candidatus Omnitrophota bacterium]
MHKEKFVSDMPASLKKRFLKAFTLIEIVVALAILLILAVLVVPNILRTRINSNEIAAVSNLTSLGKAIQEYYMNNGYKYPQSLEDLMSPRSVPPYISNDFLDTSKSGYVYQYEYVDEDNFRVLVSPKAMGKTGTKYFYLDETGIVRQKEGGPAGETDPAVQ